MSKLTFVVEFEDGKEPPVHAHMEVLGGKVVAVAFRDALEEPEGDEDRCLNPPQNAKPRS